MCHLPGLGQVGHSPKGNQWECWNPGQGPNVVRPPVHLPPTMWPTQRLIFVHMAGWLANCSWLADWLSNKMSTWPSLQAEISGGQVCCYFGQVDPWSDVPSQTEASCGQVWYYFRYGWPVYSRVHLMPAAVVIPGPLAYFKVVAVKKLALSLFVEVNKFKSCMSSYHPMQKG